MQVTRLIMLPLNLGRLKVWDCKYHIAWVTKYRYPVLGGDAGQRYREVLRKTARSKEMIIYVGVVNSDHIHMLIRNTTEFTGI